MIGKAPASRTRSGTGPDAIAGSAASARTRATDLDATLIDDEPAHRLRNATRRGGGRRKARTYPDAKSALGDGGRDLTREERSDRPPWGGTRGAKREGGIP
jgi:hypothetical protein